MAVKREELSAAQGARPEIERRAEKAMPARRGFAAALRRNPPSIIAEIKKASPSKGIITNDFDPARMAAAYEAGGAAALSVLTDARFFQGSLGHLQTARATVNLPVLRKDFTIDPFHVVEAAAHGADAILLIVAILTERELRDLRELTERYSMDALVEVHDRQELDVAVASGASLIGVNNRDLRTFQVSLETSLQLAERIPDDAVRVAESGIQSREHVRQLRQAGYHAFLVGEHLMRSPDPAQGVRALR